MKEVCTYALVNSTYTVHTCMYFSSVDRINTAVCICLVYP